jgi:hypothetical protein
MIVGEAGVWDQQRNFTVTHDSSFDVDRTLPHHYHPTVRFDRVCPVQRSKLCSAAMRSGPNTEQFPSDPSTPRVTPLLSSHDLQLERSCFSPTSTTKNRSVAWNTHVVAPIRGGLDRRFVRESLSVRCLHSKTRPTLAHSAHRSAVALNRHAVARTHFTSVRDAGVFLSAQSKWTATAPATIVGTKLVVGVSLNGDAEYSQGGTLNISIAGLLVDIAPRRYSAGVLFANGAPVWRQLQPATLRVTNGAGTSIRIPSSLLILSQPANTCNAPRVCACGVRVWAGVLFAGSLGATWQQLDRTTITIQGNAVGTSPRKINVNLMNTLNICTVGHQQPSTWRGEANGTSFSRSLSPPSRRAPRLPSPQVRRHSLTPTHHHVILKGCNCPNHRNRVRRVEHVLQSHSVAPLPVQHHLRPHSPGRKRSRYTHAPHSLVVGPGSNASLFSRR